MTLLELFRIASDEKRCYAYLRRAGILKTFNRCIHCNSTKLGNIRRDRIKCYSCKREWSYKKNSILENIRVNPSKFLLCLHCFILDLSTTTCAEQTDINNKTAQRVYTLFRQSLLPEQGNLLSIPSRKSISLRIGVEDSKIHISECQKTNHKSSSGPICFDHSYIIKFTRTRNNIGEIRYNITTDYRPDQSKSDGYRYSVGRIESYISYLKDKLMHYNSVDLKELLLYVIDAQMRFNFNHTELHRFILAEIAKM